MFCPACGATLADAPPLRERRKLVTIVFADVVGSTALGERVDSETLRWAMQRWFERMRDVIERHGGVVEKYIGDAVMAVFGIPVAHEDDALRAVRAAAEMREAVAVLRGELRRERGVELAVRIGVNTGEAVTGAAPDGGIFTAGDTVNVAARLEQSATAGDVLLGRETHRLVGHAVEAEPVAPLTVKGKSATVEAFRLLTVAPHARGRAQRRRAPLLGRAAERRGLLEAFDRAVGDRAPVFVTVVGEPGVGKSRLVDEVTEALQGSATIAAGRCLPYGDGLTWWPLGEALGDLFEQIADPRQAAFRTAGATFAGERVSPEDAFWAIRTVLETLARRRPLVLCIDDVQWAEPTLLDALEHVGEWADDAPLLVICMARPEFLEQRPAWGEGAVDLTPLAEPHASDLLRHLLGPWELGERPAGRVLDAAAGNPLFLEELVAILIDDGVLRPGDGPRDEDALAVPSTIKALLAARLDRLDARERTVIEAASIEGLEFDGAHLRTLLAGEGIDAIDGHLAGLVHKDLIEPLGEDRYRFCHLLVRDAAYEGMSKELRSTLHERLADAFADEAVVEEVLGYHLESTVTLRRELGHSEEDTAGLAERATATLSTAGHRAAQRADPAAASALLERAIALADSGARGALLPALGASLFDGGRMAEAAAILDDAIERAPDERFRALARVEREFVRLEAETAAGTAGARQAADDALDLFGHTGDHHGQCRALSLRAQVEWLAGQAGRADADWSAAAEHARAAGDDRELFVVLGWRATAAVFGPTPVDEGIRLCEELREAVSSSRVTVAWMINPLASLHAMRGDFALADHHLEEANAILRQLGALQAVVSYHELLVHLLAGRPERAEPPLRAGIERLAAMDDAGLRATAIAMLAQAVFAQGRHEEAEALCREAAAAGAEDDIVTQYVWRGVAAKVQAHDGRLEDAEALAREAVALVEPTDWLSHHGDAMLDLAEVLGLMGRAPEAATAVDAAVALYERKGNAAAAALARSQRNNHSGRR